ncbi:MAG: hypothetical protein AAF565_04585 [Pseudomonadota bacterium]
MSRRAAETLRLLHRLREAARDGARARLALANREVRRLKAETEAKEVRHAHLATVAEQYMPQAIRDLGPTRDGASVYASLAVGASETARVARVAAGDLNAMRKRQTEAAAGVELAASAYVGSVAEATAIGRRSAEVERAVTRLAARRQDDEAVDTWSARRCGGGN